MRKLPLPELVYFGLMGLISITILSSQAWFTSDLIVRMVLFALSLIALYILVKTVILTPKRWRLQLKIYRKIWQLRYKIRKDSQALKSIRSYNTSILNQLGNVDFVDQAIQASTLDRVQSRQGETSVYSQHIEIHKEKIQNLVVLKEELRLLSKLGWRTAISNRTQVNDQMEQIEQKLYHLPIQKNIDIAIPTHTSPVMQVEVPIEDEILQLKDLNQIEQLKVLLENSVNRHRVV